MVRACWKIYVLKKINKQNGLTGKWCLNLFRICCGWFGLTFESEKSGMEIYGFQKEKELQISSNGGFYTHKHTSSVNCLEGIHSMIQYGLVQK